MKSVILSGLLMLIGSQAIAADDQPKFEIRPSMVRCVSQTVLSDGWKQQGMNVVVYTYDKQTNTIKAIAMDPMNSIMIVDILPDGKACILDYYENAYIGIKPNKMPEEKKPMKQEQS